MQRRPNRPAGLVLVGILLAWSRIDGAVAQTDLPGDPAAPASPIPGAAEGAGQAPSYEGDIFTRGNLFGDIGGLRTFLGRYGVTFGLQETSELFGNPTGGVNTGVAYNGAMLMGLGVDTQQAVGLQGGTFNITAWQIHGRSLTTDNLHTVQPLTEAEAIASTRLWELWYQQSFLSGLLDLKLGQQAIDMEFMITQYGSLFLNAAMGWPALPGNDMFAGGPTFPLSSLGARIRAHPTGELTWLAGIYDDNPPGGPFDDDSQVRGAERSGTAFNLNTGALIISELQYTINQPAAGGTGQTGAKPGLPGTYKFGGWFDTGPFLDQRYDNAGIPLASPASNGIPLTLRHNFSLYGVMDQMVWRPAPDSPQSVGVFLRVMGAPGDRNLLEFSANGGVTLKAPLPGRDDDTAGVGFGIAKISGAAIGFDHDTALYSGSPYPIRSAETFIEVTYQFTVTPWLQIQPDFQYFFLPSGGVPNPNSPGNRIGNEAVFGVHTNIVF
jgi:porin